MSQVLYRKIYKLKGGKLRPLFFTISMICLFMVLMIMPGQNKAATVYKSVDKQGNVTFSDQPTPGSEKVTIEPQTTVKTPQSQQPSPYGPPPSGQGFPQGPPPPGYNGRDYPPQYNGGPPSPNGAPSYPNGTPSTPLSPDQKQLPPYLNQYLTPGRDYYKTFEMVYPQDKQTFHNERRIIVSFDINPPLRSGDLIQLYVDGQPYGPPQASTNLLLYNLDRGEHTVSAKLIDRNGRAIFTLSDRTIYIHYASIGPRSISLEIKKSALELNKPALRLNKEASKLIKTIKRIFF